MTTYFKILLIIIAVAYLISPLDLIPDLYIPWFGWIDDTFFIGLLIYYLRFGRLPGFIYRQNRSSHRTGMGDQAQGKGRSEPGPDPRNPSQNSRSGPDLRQKARKVPPHEILGVSPDATPEEIQAAYRKAVKAYHPDRVASLGPELQELANKKFIEIKEAYNRLMAS